MSACRSSPREAAVVVAILSTDASRCPLRARISESLSEASRRYSARCDAKPHALSAPAHKLARLPAVALSS